MISNKRRPRGWRVSWSNNSLWKCIKGQHIIVYPILHGAYAGYWGWMLNKKRQPEVWMDYVAACMEIEESLRKLVK